MIAAPPPVTTSADELAAEVVHQYAADVVAGRIVANRYVRLACERHVRWLERTDIRFDAAKAGHGIRFFSFLRLHEGQFEGQPFVLSPWQAFIVGSIEGWYFRDGDDWIRMIRNAYVETGKGSGKTPLGAGITGYGLVEGKSGAQCYSAAAGRDQSKIPWNDFRLMVEKSPALRSRIQSFATSLAGPKGSSFGYCSSEARNLHGKRVYRALLEELHAHETDEVIERDARRHEGVARRADPPDHEQRVRPPLVCWADHEYSINVLEGVLEDDHWFGFVCGLDMCDEHRPAARPSTAARAATSGPTRRSGRRRTRTSASACRAVPARDGPEAIGKPSQQSIVKRLNFCIWTEGSGKWLDVAAFARSRQPARSPSSAIAAATAGSTSRRRPTSRRSRSKLPRGTCDVEGHAGRCYDLLVSRFWLPEEPPRRVRRDHVPYDVWAATAGSQTTPGNRVDQERDRATSSSLGRHIVGRRHRPLEHRRG
jgi:phage terminase large subunit-like protein